MNQTLEQLIKLQEIDQRLLEIKEHMGDLPSKVESQELEVSSLNEENNQNNERLSEIEKNIRHHVGEIENFTSKLEKYKEQLFLVKSNKEYDAINQEIDHMKSTIANSESVQLDFEEEKNTLEESIKLNSTKIETLSESLNLNKTELDAAMEETIQEQKELYSNRDSLYKDINQDYLDSYIKLRDARNGVGMVSIINSACGDCYSTLPPQTVIEIKENNDIIICPNCSIMLYWDGSEEF
tara:strand:+ start:1151 stop:1867 length:717 start_codon:yes stop_codon:yes gene_type:complete